MKYLYALVLSALLWSCAEKAENTEDETVPAPPVIANPEAEGFDLEGSDARAIALADSVMLAMGGRQHWDNTNILAWDFFGRRSLIWNKKTGDVRIEVPEQQATLLVNIYSHEGKVKIGEEEYTNADSLLKYSQMAEAAWINDAYWLIMPYKLKDSGVTLKYAREDTTLTGKPADVLQLTFKEVGLTPENKYEVWIDKSSKLIRQWAFYPTIDSEAPRFITPWDDYQRYGNIQLSGNRGDYRLDNIHVYDSLPASVFTSFEPVELN